MMKNNVYHVPNYPRIGEAVTKYVYNDWTGIKEPRTGYVVALETFSLSDKGEIVHPCMPYSVVVLTFRDEDNELDTKIGVVDESTNNISWSDEVGGGIEPCAVNQY